MNVFKLENVRKEFKTRKESFEALKGIDLEINKGDFIVICGESGAGKSTLLNILETLSVPSSGKVIFEGRDISTLSSKERAKIRNEKIGILLQNFPLIEKFDVFDNVRIPYYFSDIPLTEQEPRVLEVLTKLGIAHLKKKSVKKLSGGERQRVAIARALVINPDVIIADEPTSNLDAGNRDMFMELMHRLNEEGKTVIISSHDKEIIDSASKLITLRLGEIA